MKHTLLAAALVFSAQMAVAQEMVTYQTDLSYEDVVFGLENAILDEGLVIDSVSHVGDMLERTRADVGSDVVLFEKAEVFSFCSAKVSRAVMEADPMNIAYCPYGIFVAERSDDPGRVTIGFRQFPEGTMQQVQSLLDGIVQSAVEE